MSGHEDIGHSVLIVSASEQFNQMVRRSLKGVLTADVRKSVAMARRLIMERYYDLVIINAPLPDEPGEQFAIDVVREYRASVLMIVPAQIYDAALDYVTDHGIMVLSKPLNPDQLDKGVRFLMAVQNTINTLQRQIRRTQEKMEEMRIIDKAKIVLAGKSHMTEDEAHRFIGKQAMNAGVSRRRIAERILDDYMA